MALNRMETGQNMRTYKVNKTQLLETLQKNLEKHKNDVKDGWEEYKRLVKLDIKEKKKLLTKSLNDLESKFEDDPKTKLNVFVNPNPLYFDLTPPVSYIKEYEEVIEGFKWEVEEVIELDSKEFARYVRDDWDWKDNIEVQKRLYESKSIGFAR